MPRLVMLVVQDGWECGGRRLRFITPRFCAFSTSSTPFVWVDVRRSSWYVLMPISLASLPMLQAVTMTKISRASGVRSDGAPILTVFIRTSGCALHVRDVLGVLTTALCLHGGLCKSPERYSASVCVYPDLYCTFSARQLHHGVGRSTTWAYPRRKHARLS